MQQRTDDELVNMNEGGRKVRELDRELQKYRQTFENGPSLEESTLDEMCAMVGGMHSSVKKLQQASSDNANSANNMNKSVCEMFGALLTAKHDKVMKRTRG